MRMACMGSLESVLKVTQVSLLCGTVCMQMARSGSWSEARPYVLVIVWADLIQGNKLSMASWEQQRRRSFVWLYYLACKVSTQWELPKDPAVMWLALLFICCRHLRQRLANFFWGRFFCDHDLLFINCGHLTVCEYYISNVLNMYVTGNCMFSLHVQIVRSERLVRSTFSCKACPSFHDVRDPTQISILDQHGIRIGCRHRESSHDTCSGL